MGVTVRHNAAVAAVVALLASVMTVAWFARALQTGSPVDWALTLVLAAIGVLQLLVVRDSRAPLLVADEHGVRVRRGRTWSGLRWQDVAHVEVRSPGSWLRDGEVVVHPVTEDAHERFSVPLGMTTRVDHDGLTGDLVTDLDSLASGEVPVLVLTGVPHSETQTDPAQVSEHPEHPEHPEHSGDHEFAEQPAARELEDFGAPVRWRDRRRPWQSAPEQDVHDADGLDEPDEADAREEVATSTFSTRFEETDEIAVVPASVDVDDAPAHDTAREAAEETADEAGHETGPRTSTRDRLGELRRLVALGVARAGQRRPSTEADVEDQDQDQDRSEVETDADVPAEHPVEHAAEHSLDHTVDHTVEHAADHPVDAVEETEDEVEPVEPGRATRPASRAEVVRESVRVLPTPPPIPEQRARRDEDAEDLEPAGASATTGSTLAAAQRPVPVLVARLDDLGGQEPRGPEHPVIGPRINAARHRARLSIDTLGERTRIRPHVLERIEVDDFEACGGDFYARGHLRTLARIFGLDAEELVALYDEHYASPEIEARQVFEAELASGIGGGVRAAHSGPRWSLMAASVLVLAGVWGVSRLADDTPQELVSPAPQVVDSAGLASSEKQQPASSLAPVEVRATGATPEVVVRDRGGRILWAGRLADGQRQQVIGLAPFEVTSSNGGAVHVSYLGRDQGVVGQGAAAASKSVGSR
ncbi:hypothetical protein GCM10027596_12760 [Nocardioides korecus]